LRSAAIIVCENSGVTESYIKEKKWQDQSDILSKFRFTVCKRVEGLTRLWSRGLLWKYCAL